MRRLAPLVVLAAALAVPAPAAAQPREGEWIARDFRFASGETLPELRLHWRTLGTPRRDARGTVTNAVLVLHGTGGSGAQFLSPQWAGELYGRGQPFDTATHYVILPDGIGHGRSSKPSDGLRARFPRYGYADMVRAQHLLVTQGLGVDRLRVVIGTSMGCMHAWMWGVAHPDAVDALVPLACAPAQIAGRNRMIRTMMMDAIRDDPAWHGGDYTTPPPGLRSALHLLFMMSSAPLVQQAQAPTRDAADSTIRRWLGDRTATTDANDLLYQFDASRDYDPSAGLASIRARVLAINSADDFVNPPELGIVEPLVARVPGARFVLVPTGPTTRGHSTHTWATVWKGELERFLATLPAR